MYLLDIRVATVTDNKANNIALYKRNTYVSVLFLLAYYTSVENSSSFAVESETSDLGKRK